MPETLQEAQQRLGLLPREMDRAFARARRRSIGAGRDRAYRQLKRITGLGTVYWKPNRVYAGPNRLTGDGSVWVGLNPARMKQGRIRRFPQLPQDFDPQAIESAMVQVLDAELEKAATDVLSGRL